MQQARTLVHARTHARTHRLLYNNVVRAYTCMLVFSCSSVFVHVSVSVRVCVCVYIYIYIFIIPAIHAKCSEYSIGPHTDTCLKMIWTRYCLADGTGNPLHSHTIRDIANLGTLRSFVTMVTYVSNKAKGGSSSDLRLCYGDKSKCE